MNNSEILDEIIRVDYSSFMKMSSGVGPVFRIIGGISAIVFYGIHAGYLIMNSQAYHVLWICHLGCLLVGIGVLTQNRYVNAIGFMWLVFGVPIWGINIAATGKFMTTSTLTHCGGIIIGLGGIGGSGMLRRSWILAVLGMIGMGVLCRIITPAEANVNLAFAVWQGWEKYFPSHFWFVLMLILDSLILFYIIEYLALRLRSATYFGSAQ
ncbi:MAG: hypothetical protein GY754_22325 [bacterium]|nr:hypothetical protein [bacterium]